eukprot:TRINITY_DN27512_c0_g1_i1.p2 TRINITY_DN27512_c0_g1~~TRINITY_DN27512_c0_g1_i1.p2  ORF type:complete len:105 (+),score=6.05 TRINITY_DN27512_c0_g1_i1:66-380(+)
MMVRDRVAAWTREKDRCISAPLRPVLGAPSVRSRTAFWIIEGVVEEEEEEEDCMPVGGVVALAALACLTTQSNACLNPLPTSVAPPGFILSIVDAINGHLSPGT